MIKLLSKDGRSVMLGLSARNLQLLQERKPIVFDGAVIGFDGFQVCIFYGETEEAMVEELTQAGIMAPATIDVIQKAKGT